MLLGDLGCLFGHEQTQPMAKPFKTFGCYHMFSLSKKYRLESFFLCRFLLRPQNGGGGSPLIWNQVIVFAPEIDMDVVFWGPGEKIDDGNLDGLLRIVSHMCFFGDWWNSLMMQHATTLVLVVATHIFFGKFHPGSVGKRSNVDLLTDIFGKGG